jgi:predicted MFS family arabinose efflux permease
MGKIFRSLYFWRIAPWAALNQGSFMAIQGLWAGPWLIDVAGYSRETSALILMLIAVSMVAGFILIGAIAHRLNSRGVPLTTVLAGGLTVFLLVLLSLTLPVWRGTPVLWMLFGFFGTSGALAYATLSRHVPKEAAGKVNTSQNTLLFLCAFGAQWGVGGIIESAPAADGLGYAPGGYQNALLVLVALLAAAAIWFFVSGWLLRRGASENPAPRRS